MTPPIDPIDTEVPRSRLWLRVLFGASLAMNLLVVGLAVGAALRFGDRGDGMRPPPHSFGATMYREMSHKDRHALRAAMKKDAPEEHFARRKADAQAIGTALRADPFNAEVIETLLEQQAAHRQNWQLSVQDAWLIRLQGMSAAERSAYADRLEMALMSPRGPHKHKDRNHD